MGNRTALVSFIEGYSIADGACVTIIGGAELPPELGSYLPIAKEAGSTLSRVIETLRERGHPVNVSPIEAGTDG
jgi:hypothetical protein